MPLLPLGSETLPEGHAGLAESVSGPVGEALASALPDARRKLSPKGLDTWLNGVASLGRLGRGDELVIAWIEAGVSIEIEEARMPLREEVSGVCEILGLDPLYLANEGRLVLFCAPEGAEAVLAAMQSVPEGEGAVLIGYVKDGIKGRVSLRTRFGGTRIVDMLVGDQLPRIC